MRSDKTVFKCRLFAPLGLLTGLFVLGFGLSPVSRADDDPGQRYQTANIVDFHTGVVVAGAATLTRSENSAIAKIHTSGLHKKAAYSIWWVIWNEPENCVGGCGEDDIEIDGNAIFYAGGFVTGTDGTANTQVSVHAGDPPMGAEVLVGEGLDEDNGFDAEMHLVIRSHGKIIPGMVDIQVGSFDGACDINNCIDHQSVVFAP